MPISAEEIMSLISGSESSIVRVAHKVLKGVRISNDEALALFQSNDLALLSLLATWVREQKNERKVYFNRNIHFEPTNICIYHCQFCSYARKPGQQGAWDYSLDDMERILQPYQGSPITELHIVSGVQKEIDLAFFIEIIRRAKKILPGVTIKAFTAVELDYVFRKAGVSVLEGLNQLREAGLETLPGGGAEIFHPDIRQRICPEKCNADRWLEIHEAAHNLGLPSNATILYGHYEDYGHRVHHMDQLRALQDRTGGFNAFIPLKYRHLNNPMQALGEVPLTEDLKNFAVSRIYLDNFDHIKAYWPMLGKTYLPLTLAWGVDDLDGTIDDSTRIYTMAGADDQSTSMTPSAMQKLISESGYTCVERDSFYRPVL